MAIRVRCENCHAQFSARDELAGKRGKCPKCQAAICVPTLPGAGALRETLARSQASVTLRNNGRVSADPPTPTRRAAPGRRAERTPATSAPAPAKKPTNARAASGKPWPRPFRMISRG